MLEINKCLTKQLSKKQDFRILAIAWTAIYCSASWSTAEPKWWRQMMSLEDCWRFLEMIPKMCFNELSKGEGPLCFQCSLKHCCGLRTFHERSFYKNSQMSLSRSSFRVRFSTNVLRFQSSRSHLWDSWLKSEFPFKRRFLKVYPLLKILEIRS